MVDAGFCRPLKKGTRPANGARADNNCTRAYIGGTLPKRGLRASGYPNFRVARYQPGIRKRSATKDLRSSPSESQESTNRRSRVQTAWTTHASCALSTPVQRPVPDFQIRTVPSCEADRSSRPAPCSVACVGDSLVAAAGVLLVSDSSRYVIRALMAFDNRYKFRLWTENPHIWEHLGNVRIWVQKS